MFKCAELLNEEKEKATEISQWLGMLEARAGVEPTYTDLQSDISHIDHILKYPLPFLLLFWAFYKPNY